MTLALASNPMGHQAARLQTTLAQVFGLKLDYEEALRTITKTLTRHEPTDVVLDDTTLLPRLLMEHHEAQQRSEHATFTRDAWRHATRAGETSLDYWGWAAASCEENGFLMPWEAVGNPAVQRVTCAGLVATWHEGRWVVCEPGQVHDVPEHSPTFHHELGAWINADNFVVETMLEATGMGLGEWERLPLAEQTLRIATYFQGGDA